MISTLPIPAAYTSIFLCSVIFRFDSIAVADATMNATGIGIL